MRPAPAARSARTGGDAAPPVYRAEADQFATKSVDFSPSSIRDRWQAGQRDAGSGADRLAGHAPVTQRPIYTMI